MGNIVQIIDKRMTNKAEGVNEQEFIESMRCREWNMQRSAFEERWDDGDVEAIVKQRT
jgi:hypothetical protein